MTDQVPLVYSAFTDEELDTLLATDLPVPTNLFLFIQRCRATMAKQRETIRALERDLDIEKDGQKESP